MQVTTIGLDIAKNVFQVRNGCQPTAGPVGSVEAATPENVRARRRPKRIDTQSGPPPRSPPGGQRGGLAAGAGTPPVGRVIFQSLSVVQSAERDGEFSSTL
jgi:hypothetical protein